MNPRTPPFFGFPANRGCSRWLGDHDCGKDAVRHVIWTETMENGFVCLDHVRELGTLWAFIAAHEVGPDCGMPGSVFYIDENVCRCDDLPTTAPALEREEVLA